MNSVEIGNSTVKDLPLIFKFYREAVVYQKPLFENHWPEFSKEMVLNEIKELRQFKLLIDKEVACIWAITFSDPEIWGDRDRNDAIYIHRIATHPKFRGQKFVEKILSWATFYARKHTKDFVRMDTVGKNEKLISHYQKCGFNYLGLRKLNQTANLPSHYHNAVVSLFEYSLI
ncbi:GNAT family N-acetyltransferase [Flavobacteriaceae bacterium M23B6Z8]